MDRLLALLPHYVVGVIWCLDIVLVILLMTTVTGLQRFTNNAATLLAPFRFPDFAVGFLLITVGGVLPYAAARTLTPLADIILNLTIRRFRFYRSSLPLISVVHYETTRARIQRLFGVPPPESAWSDLIMQYLIHIQSATALGFERRESTIHERGRLTFPIALLVGITVYAAGRQCIVSLAAGIIVALAVATLVIHSANTSLQRWNEEVILAFLAITGESETPSPECLAGADTPDVAQMNLPSRAP